MALARTDLDSESDKTVGVEPTGISTAFTPPNNSLLVVVAAIQGYANAAGTLSISGGSLTYTNRHSSTAQFFGATPNYYGRLACWTAPVATGASMTVTVQDSASTISDQGNTLLSIFAYTGYDTGTPIGATASSAVAGDAGLTLTLSAGSASDSAVVAMRTRADNGSVATGATPNAANTEIHDIGSTDAGYIDLETMDRVSSTSTSVVWDDTSTNASASSWLRHSFAMEIKADAGAATGQPTMMRWGGVPGMTPGGSQGRTW